jgi:hypothetical protein
MKKRAVLVFIVATFWLVNGLFCFCEMGITGPFASGNISACTDEPLSSAPETSDDDCCVCCGHFVFTPANFVTVEHHFIQQNFLLQSFPFSNQSGFRSVYHPPKA